MDDTVRTTPSPAHGSAPGSPKTTKIKFLCSQGGRILLRPGDGVLKYVGGETRVVSVPRNIDFSGLSKKIATLNHGEVILKYQLLHEDLDALVTVRTDQDLLHMLDEYDRHELSGAPKLRAFLFPSSPAITDFFDPHSLDQHYIDAINGVFRIGPPPKHSILNAVPTAAAAASSTDSSSPKSLDSVTGTGTGPSQDAIRMHNYITSQLFMHKVQSSPNLLANHNHYHHQSPQNGSGCQSPVVYQFDRQMQSPQNVSGYQSPVVYQFDKQMQTPPRRPAVEQRKAGYPPSIRHLRSVSAIFQNEEYAVERKLEMEDWLSRMR